MNSKQEIVPPRKNCRSLGIAIRRTNHTFRIHPRRHPLRGRLASVFKICTKNIKFNDTTLTIIVHFRKKCNFSISYLGLCCREGDGVQDGDGLHGAVLRLVSVCCQTYCLVNDGLVLKNVWSSKCKYFARNELHSALWQYSDQISNVNHDWLDARYISFHDHSAPLLTFTQQSFCFNFHNRYEDKNLTN